MAHSSVIPSSPYSMEISVVSVAVCIVGYYLLRYLWELITVGKLKDKAVFISGCDSGFGRALSLKCAKAGMTVFSGCFTKEGETSLSHEAEGLPLYTLPLDVTNDDSVKKARAFVDQNLKPGIKFWAVVCNAGVFSCHGPDDWCTIQDYKQAIDVNTFGVIRCVKSFMDLVKNNEGRVVAVSSVAGRVSVPFGAPYAVAKYGVEAYMDAIRQETMLYGVKCCLIEPGVFKTALIDKAAMDKRVETVWGRLDDRTRSQWGEKFKDFFKNKWNETFHMFGSSRIDYVVDNYFHAITAQFPRHRYLCGYDALFLWRTVSLVDSRFTDWISTVISGADMLPADLEKKLKRV